MHRVCFGFLNLFPIHSLSNQLGESIFGASYCLDLSKKFNPIWTGHSRIDRSFLGVSLIKVVSNFHEVSDHILVKFGKYWWIFSIFFPYFFHRTDWISCYFKISILHCFHLTTIFAHKNNKIIKRFPRKIIEFFIYLNHKSCHRYNFSCHSYIPWIGLLSGGKGRK